MTADDDSKLASSMAGVGALVVSLTIGAVLSPFRETLGPENAAILYMAVVATAAASGGLGGGLIAAAVAAMSYNFFFTTPYLTLKIDSAEQVLTVLLLFAAGAVTALVSHAYRSRVEPAERRQREAVQLVDAVLAGDDADSAWRTAVEGLQRLTDARWVGVLVPDSDVASVAVGGSVPEGVEVVARTPTRHLSSAAGDPHRRGTSLVVPVDGGTLVVVPQPGRAIASAERLTMLAVAQAMGLQRQWGNG